MSWNSKKEESWEINVTTFSYYSSFDIKLSL